MREGVEKDTPRQLKGRYYLTKIAHLLLPHNIPDVYQASESSERTQTVDVERIAHTPGHKLFQEVHRSGGDPREAGERIAKEMSAEMSNLTDKLADIGLGFNVDESFGNYTKDEEGNVYYLETFKPWKTDPTNPKKLEILFNEEELRESIEGISDEDVKTKSLKHLERLLALLEEEKQELQKQEEIREARLLGYGPHTEELEALLAPFMKEDALEALNSLEIEEEARGNEERRSANEALTLIFKKLNFLKDETNISDEKYRDLYVKYKILSRAVGIINNGVVDHKR